MDKSQQDVDTFDLINHRIDFNFQWQSSTHAASACHAASKRSAMIHVNASEKVIESEECRLPSVSRKEEKKRARRESNLLLAF
jgi:hypothetical protein